MLKQVIVLSFKFNCSLGQKLGRTAWTLWNDGQ